MNQQPFLIQNSIQYLQEYQYQQNNIQIKLTDENNKRYKYPVLTLHCNHIKYALNLQTVLQSINQKGYFICNCNNIQVNHPCQLQKDIRWNVNEEINEIFDHGFVIHNYICHQFMRAKKFNVALQQNSVLLEIKKLIESSNAINNIHQILQTICNNNQNQRQIIFKAICLLDFVQLNIPVRFKQCQHLECYDLASLLIFQKENYVTQNSINKLKEFRCKQRQCQVKVDISTQEKIFQNINLDKELLKLIKKGVPSIYKYIYDPFTQQIQQDCLIQDQMIVDQKIHQKYQQDFRLEVQPLDKDYQDYQKQIILLAYNILQRPLNRMIEQNLKLNKYKIYQVATTMNQNIEQPARCINCPLSNVMDLKLIISHFQSQKKKYQQNIQLIECPLCKKKYNYMTNLTEILYFDQNLFDAQEQGLLENNAEIICYNGKKFMIEEFIFKQKLELIEFKKYLQENYQNQRFTFNRYCNSNPTKLIKMPLILKNCPQKRIIEFETFYNVIKDLKTENYEQKCFQFCNCQYCVNNPFSFKEFSNNVYFHEAFQQALNDFKIQNSNINQFTYDFQCQKVIVDKSINQIPINTVRNESLRQGFEPISDEAYKEQFDQKTIQNHTVGQKDYQYQIIEEEIKNSFGKLINNKNGYSQEGNKNQICQKLGNNKWGFEILKTETQFSNNNIKQLREK